MSTPTNWPTSRWPPCRAGCCSHRCGATRHACDTHLTAHAGPCEPPPPDSITSRWGVLGGHPLRRPSPDRCRVRSARLSGGAPRRRPGVKAMRVERSAHREAALRPVRVKSGTSAGSSGASAIQPVCSKHRRIPFRNSVAPQWGLLHRVVTSGSPGWAEALPDTTMSHSASRRMGHRGCVSGW